MTMLYIFRCSSNPIELSRKRCSRKQYTATYQHPRKVLAVSCNSAAWATERVMIGAVCLLSLLHKAELGAGHITWNRRPLLILIILRITTIILLVRQAHSKSWTQGTMATIHRREIAQEDADPNNLGTQSLYPHVCSNPQDLTQPRLQKSPYWRSQG